MLGRLITILIILLLTPFSGIGQIVPPPVPPPPPPGLPIDGLLGLLFLVGIVLGYKKILKS